MTSSEYKNTIEWTLRRAEESDDLSTVKRILRNLGTPFPQGNVENIVNLLSSGNYMGWNPCNKEQARFCVNNGYPAVAVTDDTVVILLPDDESVKISSTVANSVSKLARKVSELDDSKEGKTNFFVFATLLDDGKKDANGNNMIAAYSTDTTCDSGCQVSCQTTCQTNCQSGCIINCQNVCETGCMDNCESSCQSCNTCQSTCESSCQSCNTCQSTCQTSCQSCNVCDNCQTGCQVNCQVGCLINCQNVCETGCMDNCESSCQSCNTCQSTCESICQTACQSSCQNACESSCQSCNVCDDCQVGCQISCQSCNTCQNVCESTCQTCNACESSCQGCDTCQTNDTPTPVYPTVSITSPQADCKVEKGAVISISASGTNCATIEIFVNDSSLYVANGNSASFNYSFASYGTYTISAKATSSTGHTSVSDTRTITVEILTYTVRYDINGGRGSTPAPQTFKAGEEVILASLNHPKDCYRLDNFFDGWNTKSDGSGTLYNTGDTVRFTSDVTLYAQFSYAFDLLG